MTELRRILAVSIILVFVFCLSNAVFAKETEYSLSGKVISVDPLTRNVIVKATDEMPSLISGNLGEFTFHMDPMTQVTMCEQTKTPGDIRIGQQVTVSYHAAGGRFYADAITLAPPLVACLLE